MAAITIPSISASTRRLEVETKLKQTHSILNNALTFAVADNGPIYTWDEIGSPTDSTQSISFFNTYLAPYLYFAKKYDKYKLSDFGYYDIKRPNKTVVQSVDVSATRAVLNNGTVIISSSSSHFKEIQNGYIAVNYFVDINGPKKPNILGKDIFIFSLIYFMGKPQFNMLEDAIASYYIISQEIYKLEYLDNNELIQECKNTGNFCGALIQRNGWKIPKDYPLNI